MPQGFEGYNEAEQVIFSETSYAGNFVSSFQTNGQQSGSFSNAALVGKRLVYFTPQAVSSYGGPEITLNPDNGVVSWSYSIQAVGQGQPSYPSEIVFYGGY